MDARDDGEHGGDEDEPGQGAPARADAVLVEAGVGGGEEGDLEDEGDEGEDGGEEGEEGEGRRGVHPEAAGDEDREERDEGEEGEAAGCKITRVSCLALG
jgi:hypothetical protein